MERNIFSGPPQVVSDTMTQDSPDVPPQEGGWAEVISGLPWIKGREGESLKSAFLSHLSQMPVVREPVWRKADNQYYEPTSQIIGDSLARIEACRMQISGNRAHLPCKNCDKGNGQFSQCIIVTGFPGVTSCANCHWYSRGTGTRPSCEWYTAELQPPQSFKRGHIVFGGSMRPMLKGNPIPTALVPAPVPAGQAPVPAGQAPVPAGRAPGQVRFRSLVKIQADIDLLTAQIPPNYHRIFARIQRHRLELALPPMDETLDNEEAENEAGEAG